MRPSSYRPELDTFRALAIVIVMLHHYLQAKIPLAGFGVMLFLTLSGYFGARALLQLRDQVAIGHLTRKEALKLFYGRRYLRILPVHLLVLGLTFVANIPYARSEFLWNVTFTSNWGMLFYGDWFGRFSPLWSLAVLEQFYLFFPLTVLLTPPRHFLKVIVGMIASAFVFRLISLAFEAGPFVWTMVPFGALDQLGCGALLAYARHAPAKESLLRLIRFTGSRIFAPLAVFIVIIRMLGTEPPYLDFYISLIACVMFAWLADLCLRGIGGWTGAFLRIPWLAAAGRASYAAFLFHSFTELIIPRIPGVRQVMESEFRFVILVPVTFFLAHLASKLIEEPLGRYRKARFQAPAIPPASPKSSGSSNRIPTM